jgi:hypothetical protein
MTIDTSPRRVATIRPAMTRMTIETSSRRVAMIGHTAVTTELTMPAVITEPAANGLRI